MNTQLEMLIRLQGLDQEVARLQQKIAEIAPQVEETRRHLREAERVLEEARQKVDGAKKDRRQAERELDAQIEKRRKFQDQQGKVKTNKEYQALMGELENLKKEETAMEDRILSLMEGVAEVEETLPALTAEVKREKAEFQEKEKALRGQEEGLRAELELVEATRATAVAEIPPESLRTYQRVQKLRGVAVVEVRDELCLGCRMNIPPQNFMQVMRNDSLQSCPHCHRILFYKKPEVLAGNEA